MNSACERECPCAQEVHTEVFRGRGQGVSKLASDGSGENGVYVYTHTHMHVCRQGENDKTNQANHKQFTYWFIIDTNM